MKGVPLRSDYIWNISPQNEYRWIRTEQEVSPYLDFEASSPLTPSAGTCREENAFPLKYLVGKH